MLRVPIRLPARVALLAVPPAALAAQPQSAGLVVVSRGAPHRQPVSDPASRPVCATRGGDGRVVVRGREVLTLDVPPVLAEAEPLRAGIAGGGL
jgi:hypothetical protein